MRVWRQVENFGTRLGADGPQAMIMVGSKVVENYDVPFLKIGDQFFIYPLDETLAVHGCEHGTQSDPPIQPHGAYQRQIAAPIHRGPFDILLPPPHPSVAASHGQIEARFVEEYHLLRGNVLHPPPEFISLGYDVRPQLLTRA